jgi:hypothetical protein
MIYKVKYKIKINLYKIQILVWWIVLSLSVKRRDKYDNS